MQWNLTEGVTEISREVYGLHMLIFGICVVIGIGVFGFMFYSVFMHRKSKGAKPANFHESTTVEIIWTVIPFVILIGMAIPAAGTLIKMEDASNADMTVKVTGYQWMWEYEYLDSGVHFYSRLEAESDRARQTGSGADVAAIDNYLLEVDNRVVLPVGKKIRFLLTSHDVLHAWWVPDLAVKKDAVPGFVREIWAKIDEPGVYRGQCAELCGQDHGFMPVVVIAKEPAEYEKWITELEAEQEAAREREQELLAMEMSEDELMDLGEKVYNSTCASCHQPTGQGVDGVFPALAGSGVSVDPDAKAKHIDIVVNGVTGTAMQAFGQQLSMRELAAVITYERNAWGNDTGDLIQPEDVHEEE